MRFSERVACYFAVWAVGTFVVAGMLLLQTQSKLADDPSAGAWVAFLPLLLPIFAVEIGKYLAVFVAVIEAVLFAMRCMQKKG